MRHLPIASKLQISKTDGAAGTYYMHTCFWISDKGAKQIIYNLKRKVSQKLTQIPKVHVIPKKNVTKKSQILALTTQFNGFRLAAKRRYPDVHVSSRLEKFDLVI